MVVRRAARRGKWSTSCGMRVKCLSSYVQVKTVARAPCFLSSSEPFSLVFQPAFVKTTPRYVRVNVCFPVGLMIGAVIPTLPLRVGDTIGVATRQYSALTFSIYPGKQIGASFVFESNSYFLFCGFVFLCPAFFSWTCSPRRCCCF